MPSVNRSALIGYSAESMFDLVNDVGAYAEFLPGCVETKIVTQTDKSMEAALLIQKAGVKQWFTTANKLERGKFIEMKLLDGPFKMLSGGWRFTELSEQACKIELDLTFEFSSKIVELAFGKVFNAIANNMVKAFTDRAKEVYGVRAAN
ncbi:type II toxin-antitoxin system RatA family toxin [Alteromonadaceae bacterium M269]|nr:type II toxin-antitoxin system RatA family toxin [Alteromonadaceae bacterium M269]